MTSDIETEAMRRAVELSARGAATTRPNPAVGAVVLTPAGTVAGEGWHERAGSAHAELNALAAAGEQGSGATLVVTLEPCNSYGRTGPCVAAIVRAGIRRVVYAVDDPTSAGGGARALRAAGVDVEGGLLAPEAEQENARWLTSVRLGRPLVVWKVAATIDGRVAAPDGTSRWISGDASRADAHQLRSTYDTIVVGVGTVLSDDPHLTARNEHGALCPTQPLRVVVDSLGRTPPSARVLDASAETWLATAQEVGRDPAGQVDLPALLRALHERGQQSVLLEGGPTLAGAFVRQGLVDRVVTYLAPLLLGAGAPVLQGTGISTLPDAATLTLIDVRRIGSDVRITAAPRAQGA